jgi:hypothetical protein
VDPLPYHKFHFSPLEDHEDWFTHVPKQRPANQNPWPMGVWTL